MNNSFSILTKEDLKKLNISEYVQDLILQGVNIESLTLQELLKIINNLNNLINKVMKENNTTRKNYTYSYDKIRKNNFKQIILTGGFLVFRIRQFLLKETIYYSLGATDENGQLFERKMSQDELWQQTLNKNTLALRGSLSQKAILLSKTLEKFNENDFQKVGNLNLWPEIVKLAFGGPAIKDKNDPQYDKYYQKDNNDKNVYVRYTEGRKKAKKNYYYKKSNKFYFYNQGWLYEWYLTYINEAENHEEQLLRSIKKRSIEPIIYGIDNIAGVSAGDFIDAKGQQVQAKFHNQQIITFNNIFNVLKEIQIILEQLIKSPKESQTAAEKFTQLFTNDEVAINHLNNTYSNIINNQLLSLLKI